MKKWAVILILIIFTLLKLPTLNTPLYRDELSLVEGSYLSLQHPTSIIYHSYATHPPLIELIIILAIKIFHFSLLIPHIISLSFSLLALFFFYKIIEFYSKDALPLTILLALTPLFFTQAGILNLDMPVCSLLLGMYYFYIKKRPIYFTIFSSLALITKEPALITYTVILIYDFLKKEKNLINYIKTKYYYSFPYLCWSIWLILSKIFMGWFIFPGHAMFIHPSSSALYFTFIHNYRFLLLPFLIIPLIKKKKHSFLLTAIIFSNLLLFSFIYLQRYLLIVIPFVYILFSQVQTKIKYLIIITLITASPFLIFPNSSTIQIGQETNMNYIKLINLEKSGFNKIPDNSQILSIWPYHIEARAGYGYTNHNYTSIVFPSNSLPEYAYASSIQTFIKSKKFNQFLNKSYYPIFENESYGHYVKVYKRISKPLKK